MSIHFFTPITYDNPHKTLPQRALEILDEYFYLGTKGKVVIFDPDTAHPQAFALKTRHDRFRSQRNVTFKVATYCTLVFPVIGLLAKQVLRYYLQISSIQVQEGFVPSSDMERLLPNEMLANIGLFLTHHEQAPLNEVAHFMQDTIVPDYKELMDPLKREIETLRIEDLKDEKVSKLLAKLIPSKAVGHPHYWVPVMNALMELLTPNNFKINYLIGRHRRTANLLATLLEPVSPGQMYQFCRYLSQHRLSTKSPWIGYRVLEQYLSHPQLQETQPKITKALKEYLACQAQLHIRPIEEDTYLPNNRSLNFIEVVVLSTVWFGRYGENQSLWKKDKEGSSMPELLVEVLWSHIQISANFLSNPPFYGHHAGKRGSRAA